jgi:hypothetical protein
LDGIFFVLIVGTYLYVSQTYADLFDLRFGCLCISFYLSDVFTRFRIVNNFLMELRIYVNRCAR